MATALVAYTAVVGTFVTLAFNLPHYVRVAWDGEKSPYVSFRLNGIVGHLLVRDIALGDVIKERAEEHGYGPEIEEQMQKFLVEMYVEKKKRDSGYNIIHPEHSIYAVDKGGEGTVVEKVPFSEFGSLGRARNPQQVV